MKNGKNITLGFGFLGFDIVDTVIQVYRDLQVKSLKLPTRFGKHRGFTFFEHVTKQETKNILQALSNTHLYRLHLVCFS
ncbi:hypothetical protein Hanom_Chr13g01183221 [Helianthus anomalus]